MERKIFLKTKLGILGGGQLAKMLLQAASKYHIHTSVLGSESSPSKGLCSKFYVGDINDYDSVFKFGNEVDVITTEIDQVNVDALIDLEKKGKKVYPCPKALKTIQNKGLQKSFFTSISIPTSEFSIRNSASEIKENHRPPFIQKFLQYGYDGKGVIAIRDESDLEKIVDAPSLVESFVNIKKEISIIVARSVDGNVKIYPPVEMITNSEANLVDYLLSPARIEDPVIEECSLIAKKIIKELSIVGILAIEMFLTKDNKILVNEISARPHNTGHHTIESNITSQFDQHLRCVLGLPLGDTRLISPAVMVNLLGDASSTGKPNYINVENVFNTENAYLHLYGKSTSKPFRKMGHITIMDEVLDLAIEKAKVLKEKVRVEV